MKNILITEGNEKYNAAIASYFADKGNNVFLIKEGTGENSDIQNISSFIDVNRRLETEEDYVEFAQLFEKKYGKIDMLIHGFTINDELTLFCSDDNMLIQTIEDKLRKIFFLNKYFGNLMVRKKEGSILFPMFLDTLAYNGYPVTPILNQAKISMMKCLARELNAFKIKVNALTFGYYDMQFDKEVRKQKKKELEIFALKPKLYTFDELIVSFDIFLNDTCNIISGQNIHIGAGAETFL